MDAILNRRSYDSSLEGSLDPLFGGCMNSNVGNHGSPCVCTSRTRFLEKWAGRMPILKSEVPIGGLSVLPSSFCLGVRCREDAGTSALPPATASGGYTGHSETET